MITRIFKLTEASAKYLGNLPKGDAILVVKSEHKVRQMFIDVLEQALYERADTKPAFDAIGAYFKGMVPDPAFGGKIDAELEALRHYVDEGLVYRPAFSTIRDYVLGKCARLCAETVHAVVGAPLSTAPRSWCVRRTRVRSAWIGRRRWNASVRVRLPRDCMSCPAATGTMPSATASAWAVGAKT